MESTTFTIKMVPEKDTPNKHVFNEVPEPGKPPMIGVLYIPKWVFVNGKPAKISVTVTTEG